MHELPVIDSILKVVLRHAAENHARQVISVTLLVGALSDLENEWMQRYFDQLSKGTIAASAVLKISRVPVIVACQSCQVEFEIAPHEKTEIVCPGCNSRQGFTMLSGREYYIKEMEII
jgi:hydrogenase nickel incorporation protein HypA/HybF